MRFIALYDGKTVSSAELLAISADQRLVQDFGRRLVTDDDPEDRIADDHPDPVRDPRRNGNGYPRRRPATNRE